MIVNTSAPKQGDARTWSFRPERHDAAATTDERARRDASARAFFERYRAQLLGHLHADTYVLELAR
jgi:hypothetical protein